MKKTFEIFMSRTGSSSGSGVYITIQADTEFEAIKEAEKRHPELKVGSVRVK